MFYKWLKLSYNWCSFFSFLMHIWACPRNKHSFNYLAYWPGSGFPLQSFCPLGQKGFSLQSLTQRTDCALRELERMLLNCYDWKNRSIDSRLFLFLLVFGRASKVNDCFCLNLILVRYDYSEACLSDWSGKPAASLRHETRRGLETESATPENELNIG